MKKVILSVAAVFAFGFASAQETTEGGFSKGDLFISGAVGFGSEKTGDLKTNDFIVAPKAGYFVTNNIAVGLAVGFAGGVTFQTEMGLFATARYTQGVTEIFEDREDADNKATNSVFQIGIGYKF